MAIQRPLINPRRSSDHLVSVDDLFLSEPVGAHLLDAGLLDEQQLRTVLNLQMQGDRRRFGAIAVVLGYITQEQLDRD